MSIRHLLLANLTTFLFLLLGACDDASQSSAPPDTDPVGVVRLMLKDSVRRNWSDTDARPLTTLIWYPAAAGTEMEEIAIPRSKPVFVGGYAARDAELEEAQGKYPLIVLSHGTGGAAMQMMWLGRELASQGFIAVAVDHHGNTAAEDAFDPRGFRMVWERPQDLSAVLDQLLVDPRWGPKIDVARIGAAGFSLGGYTVTALVGGQIDFDQFAAFCAGANRDATCDEQGEYTDAGREFELMLQNDPELLVEMADHRKLYLDDRVRAVVAIAPALGQAFTAASLARVNVPYLTIAGTADPIAPAATNAEFLAAQIPGARLSLLEGGTHYVFLNRCSKRGKRYVPVCDDPSSVSRSDVHQTVAAETEQFFRASFEKTN